MYSNTNFIDKYKIFSDHTNDQTQLSYKGKGSAILISNSWAPYLQPEETYRIKQRLTCITLRRLTHTIRIISLYYPANQTLTEGAEIDHEIKLLLSKFSKDDKIIMAGDMNTTMNPQLDRVSILLESEIQTHPSRTTPSNPIFKKLINKYDSNSLVDIWREFNPTEEPYTHFSTKQSYCWHRIQIKNRFILNI